MLGNLVNLELLGYNYSIDYYKKLCQVKKLPVQIISRKD